MKIIIFNGPPKSGKDTFGITTCKGINAAFYDKLAEPYSFKDIMFDSLLPIYGIGKDEWFDRYNSAKKNEPWARLDGKSQREAMIHYSEDVMKPGFGKDVFGKIASYTLRQFDLDGVEYGFSPVAVFTDGGFVEEVQVLADVFGIDNILIVRLHRNNCTFEGDSRDYIDMPGIDNMDVSSLGLEDTADAINHMVKEWLNK